MSDFVIDGVEYTEAEVKELISKGKDYTQKTQKVAEERRALEQEKAGISAEKEKLKDVTELADALAAEPKMAEEVKKVIAKYTDGGGNLPDKGSAEDKAMRADITQRLEQYDKFINEFKAKEEEGKLKQAYDHVDKQIIGFIKEAGIEDPDITEDLRSLAWDSANKAFAANTFSEDTLKGYITKKAEVYKHLEKVKDSKAKPPVGDKGGQGGAATPPVEAPKPGTKEHVSFVKSILTRGNGKK